VTFGYTGHAEDPAGLVWGRARCYASTTGTWMSEDPVSMESRYAYVAARSTYARDPTGRVAAMEYGLKQAVICGALGGLVGMIIGTQAPARSAAASGAGGAVACVARHHGAASGGASTVWGALAAAVLYDMFEPPS
jgi:RHS repeat-associated protein